MEPPILPDSVNLTDLSLKPKAEPYWGYPTSTLNWCEEDYTENVYIAELVNTVTNSWIIFCFISIWIVFKYQLPKRHIILWLGCCVVGFGSWCFHMTLRWEWQVLGDELPMIIATSCYLFIAMEVTPISEPKRVRRDSIIRNGGLCLCLALFICIAYLYNQNAVFHQVSFGCLLVLCVVRSYFLLTLMIPPNHPDPDVRLKRILITKLLKRGALIFFLGFVSWNIDNHFCHHLKRIRATVGVPFSFLFQLHGWWHLMTGYGAVLMATSGQLLTLIIREGAEPFDLVMWWGWFPVVVRRDHQGRYVGDKIA